jgi:hypothetical protein
VSSEHQGLTSSRAMSLTSSTRLRLK